MQHLRRNPQAKTALLPDGFIVVFLPDSEEGYTLPPLGAILWEFCDGTMTLDEIIEAVNQATAASVITSTEQLDGLVKALIDSKCLIMQ
jgi:hypothetical protein